MARKNIYCAHTDQGHRFTSSGVRIQTCDLCKYSWRDSEDEPKIVIGYLDD